MIKYILSFTLLFSSCASNKSISNIDKPKEKTIIFCQNRNLEYAIPFIKKDVETRFDNAIIWIEHGISIWGFWFAIDNNKKPLPVQKIYDDLEKRFPNRPKVFFICNKNNNRIKGKNAYIHTNIVWAIPDSFIPFRHMVSGKNIVHLHETKSKILTDLIKETLILPIETSEISLGEGAGSVWETIKCDENPKFEDICTILPNVEILEKFSPNPSLIALRR